MRYLIAGVRLPVLWSSTNQCCHYPSLVALSLPYQGAVASCQAALTKILLDFVPEKVLL